MPSNLEALMFLSRRRSMVSVSALNNPSPSKAISSIIDLASEDSDVVPSQPNLHRATAVLTVLADDSKTCLEVQINCLVAANPSDFKTRALALESSGS